MILVFNLLVPLICYSVAVAAAASFLPLSPVAATGAGAFLTAPFFYWLYRKERRMRGKEADHYAVSAKSCFFIVILGISVCIMVNNIISLSPVPAWFPEYGQVAEELYAPSVWVQLLVLGVLIPIAEEFIFRGFIYETIRFSMNFWPAAIVSSLLFAVYHGNVVQGIYAFVLALFLTWVFERYQTLLAPYLFHGAANVASVIVTSMISDEWNSSVLMSMAGTVLSVCLTVLFLRLIDKNTHPKEEKT